MKRQISISLLVAGALVLLGLPLIRALPSAHRIPRMNALRELGFSLVQYSTDHQGMYPASLSDATFVATLNAKLHAFAEQPALTYYPPRSNQSKDAPLLILIDPEGKWLFRADGYVWRENEIGQPGAALNAAPPHR